MAQLHFVKKARKTIRGTGIKKGDSYFFWKFFRKPKQVSKERPRRSQYAARSPFVASMMDAEDSLLHADDFESTAETVRSIGDDCQAKLENVSARFPNGCPATELLHSRVDACETIAQELEDAAAEINEETTVEGIQSLIDGISWSYE